MRVILLFLFCEIALPASRSQNNLKSIRILLELILYDISIYLQWMQVQYAGPCFCCANVSAVNEYVLLYYKTFIIHLIYASEATLSNFSNSQGR